MSSDFTAAVSGGACGTKEGGVGGGEVLAEAVDANETGLFQ